MPTVGTLTTCSAMNHTYHWHSYPSSVDRARATVASSKRWTFSSSDRATLSIVGTPNCIIVADGRLVNCFRYRDVRRLGISGE